MQLGTGEHQHADRQVAGPVDEMIQEVEQPGVGVLGVLDHQHHRVHRREALEEQPPPAEQLLPGQRAAAALGPRHAEQPAQPVAHVGPLALLRHEPLQAVLELGRGGLGRVFLGDAQPLPDDLGQGPERHAFPVGQAVAAVPPDILGQAVDVFPELPVQPGLADSGGAGHQDQARDPPLGGGVEQLLDRAQLRVPAHQRGLEPVHPLLAADPGQHPGGPPQRLRLGLALQGVLAGVGEPDRPARQPLRRGVGQHLPRPGRGLHPGRGVHRVPGHHALADRAQVDRHLAGHHARARGQAGHAGLGPERRHRGHQVERGPDGAFGVVLGRGGRPPHGHHRVADELLDRAAVAADHGPGHPEVAGQQLADGLGVARLG